MPPSLKLGSGSLHTRMMTFSEWRALREGLWLADKNAMQGMSRLNPFPTTQAHLKKIRGKPIEPAKPTKIRVAGVPARQPSSPLQLWDMDNLNRLELRVRKPGSKWADPHGSAVWSGNKALSWHTVHTR